jgi:hypothetical protein
MIRSEISQSPALVSINSIDKKPDQQDDFNLLLQMFTQSATVETGGETLTPQFNIESKPLMFVETAEVFSRMFAQQSNDNVNMTPGQELQPAVEELLSDISQPKLTLLNGAFKALSNGISKGAPTTLPFVDSQKVNSNSTNSTQIFTIADGGTQQVVEWGSLSIGYLSYLSPAMLVNLSAQTGLTGKAVIGLSKPGLVDNGSLSLNQGVMPPWTVRLAQAAPQVAEALFAETNVYSEAFELDSSVATQRNAALWQGVEVSREYLQVLNDERGGYRLYYRNYFTKESTQATTVLFNLLGNEVYTNLTEAIINGQKVLRGDSHGR